MHPFSAADERHSLLQYVAIARIDHWFKNAFMLLGVLLAFFFDPLVAGWAVLPRIGLALLATCLIASSNYVLNELLDGPTDSLHPIKRNRPVPRGLVDPRLAILEWLLLGALGIGISLYISPYFATTAVVFWVMGVLYNVPPIRTKEVPYVDVLTESINNPLRLFLGWFAFAHDTFPPLSLVLSFWMVGAFLMAVKRFAEYRTIGDPKVAASYRRSFQHYDEDRLLVSILFYAAACALFGGIFIVRYRVELILFVPVLAGFLAYYFRLGLQPNSPTQNPERLYQHKWFVAYVLLAAALFVFLMTYHIEWLYAVFNISDASLWQVP